MDQGRAFAGILIAAFFLLAADAPPVPIRDARWLAPSAKLEGLTRQPFECITWPSDPRERESAEIGRVAFHAPLLLGGQAARAGLSCSTCHSNGRTNRNFLFPGLSGAPGTADVTASIMSSHRGDGIFNPKPIPDLAGPVSKRIVSRDPKGQALEHFIHGLIVQEFDGPEPPRAVLEGLASYVRALSPEACRAGSVPITLDDVLADTETAVRLARRTEREGDSASARLLLSAARSNLGRIDERFQVAGLESGRAMLSAAAADLRDLEEGLGSPSEMKRWASWQSQWPQRRAALEQFNDKSLYSRAVLKRELEPALVQIGP